MSRFYKWVNENVALPANVYQYAVMAFDVGLANGHPPSGLPTGGSKYQTYEGIELAVAAVGVSGPWAVRRVQDRCLGQLRHARSDRRADLGTRQHRGLWRRPGARHDLRGVGGR